MNRILLHISFWLMYLIQDVLMIFLLNSTRMQQPPGTLLLFSVGHALILLLPKLLFTYFVLTITLNRIIEEGVGGKWTWLSAVALLLSVVLYRALLALVVNRFLYGWNDQSASFFYALGFPVALMDIGFVSGAAIAIKQIRQQLQRTKKEQLLIREKMEAELKYLRNQTHPHFLFNTLNNIYALARKRSPDTPGAIMKLSKLLRFMLYDTAKPLITIGDEIRLLENYIDLERMRYNDRLTIEFTKEIDNEQDYISPLLLLPFVENAFKHGASESRFAAFIHMRVTLCEGVLTFLIKNTKEHCDQEGKSSNIGLNNVKRQLELLYDEHDLKVVKEPYVFIVVLTINLKSYAKTNVSYC